MGRYWNRLLRLSDDRLTQKYFYGLLGQRSKGWASEMREIFEKVNMLEIYDSLNECSTVRLWADLHNLNECSTVRLWADRHNLNECSTVRLWADLHNLNECSTVRLWADRHNLNECSTVRLWADRHNLNECSTVRLWADRHNLKCQEWKDNLVTYPKLRT